MPVRALRVKIRSIDHPLLWRVVRTVSWVLARVTGQGRWYVRLAFARGRLGDAPGARTAMERALRDPGAPGSWHVRLAELAERTGDVSGAADARLTALAAAPDEPRAKLAAADTLWRAGRHGEAVDAYLAAMDDPTQAVPEPLRDPELLADASTAARERLERRLLEHPGGAAIVERRGQHLVAEGETIAGIATYRRALEACPATVTSMLRARLAQTYSSLGLWNLALTWCWENLEHHPGHAPTLRQLGRAASEVAAFGGWFEGDPASDDPFRFRALAGGQGDGLPAEFADHAELARWALERGVLAAAGHSWVGRLAAARAEAGYREGAIAAYEQAMEDAREEGKQAALKALQGFEYRLEREHHLAGRPRVTDPMFEVVTSSRGEIEGSSFVGSYLVEPDFAGLRLEGVLAPERREPVEIRLDGRLVRSLPPSEARIPRFSYRIDRAALEHFPSHSRLRLQTADGTPLWVRGRATESDLQVPHGDGALTERLARGEVLDKKGGIRPTAEQLRRRQGAYLDLYERARVYFDEEVGTPLFLMYGTLLGVHRDGDFIPGDDDFDAGYVSQRTDPEAVKAETLELIVQLVRAGFTVSYNRRGRLFRLMHPEVAEPVHLDARPLWFEDGQLWVHNYVRMPSTVEDFLPAERTTLRGTPVYVPKRTESFLRAHYGPGWRVPDPGFLYHAADVDREVLEHLGRALITPEEHQQLQRRLAEGAPDHPGQGRLVSIAEQSLYPLEDFLD